MLLAIVLGALTVTWASNTIINGMEKGIATKTLTAVDAIQQAKQQYLVDNPETDPTTQASFASLQPYLMVMGTPVTTEAQLMAGTGGRTLRKLRLLQHRSIVEQTDQSCLRNSQHAAHRYDD